MNYYSNASPIAPEETKNQCIFADILEESYKVDKFFNGLSVLPHNIKNMWVYLRDIGSHILVLNLMSNNMEQS